MGKYNNAGPPRVSLDKRLDKFTIPEPNSGCLIWLGAVNNGGYGKIRIGFRGEGTYRIAYAHRVFYEYFVGPIPEGLDLDHKCRVRCCVNPAHLEPVTKKENVHRSAMVQRHLRSAIRWP